MLGWRGLHRCGSAVLSLAFGDFSGARLPVAALFRGCSEIERALASVLLDASYRLQERGDTKIELGFSMTLAGAIPGIHPEGRRLGALRLGRRLETPKSQVWFLRITVELNPMMGFTAF